MEERHMNLLKELEKMRTWSHRKDKQKYCIQLKDEIETLIHNGFL